MCSEKLNLFIADESITLVEAMQKIDNNSNGILFITDKKGALCGSVSDGDIRRWILKGGNLNAEIKFMMNIEPKFIFYSDDVNPYQYMHKKGITALPVLNTERCIHDIIFYKNRDNEKPLLKIREKLGNVSVIIMAGGKGTRLYPYTKILPKPLIPIDDVPISERIINYFNYYGVNDFYMTLNYKKNLIRSYFSDVEHSFKINYVEEDKPLGTAGSIRLICKKFENPLFVTNCDVIIRADYSDIYNYHIKSGNVITIVAAMRSDIIPYGVIHTNENGSVEHLDEKPRRNYFVNTGMYVINPEMIDLIPINTFFHMTDLTESAINKGFKVGMYPVSEDSFLDMGEFDEMKRMEKKLKIEE